MRLSDKAAIILGGGTGMARATVLLSFNEGGKVRIIGGTTSKLGGVAKEAGK
jgi:NAD(P)-dependent dehydrogenase (short-subunit alcohol dehydrogenase family)